MTHTSLDNVKHMSGTVCRTAASNHCLFFLPPGLQQNCKGWAQTSKSGLWSAKLTISYALLVSAGSGFCDIGALPMPVSRVWGQSQASRVDCCLLATRHIKWRRCPRSHFALCCCVWWTGSQLVSSPKEGPKVCPVWCEFIYNFPLKNVFN